MAKRGFIKTKNGIFLGNVVDPLDLDSEWPSVYLDYGESEFESRARCLRWLQTKTISDPVATQNKEVYDLKKSGYIGVFYNKENGDTVLSAEEVSASFPGGRTDVDYLSDAVSTLYKIRHEDD